MFEFLSKLDGAKHGPLVIAGAILVVGLLLAALLGSVPDGRHRGGGI
jgi:hypothetical protein